MKKTFLFLCFNLTCTFLIIGQSILDSKSLEFRQLGPERGGRCTTIEGVASQPHTFYAGYTGGGVWKTTDYGQTWKNISDGYFDSPSIGSIEVYQKDPSIIYIGTGTDGLRSNLIQGRGVYKSTDSGKTWKHVGLKMTGQIGAVETHPDNPDVAFVAAIGNAFAPNKERGVFRTTDGGESWEKVLFISDKTGFADLEFHPTNPDIIYAAAWMAERKPWTIKSGGGENGIYKSTDGGATWKKMENGLPSLKGKIDLAVSPSAPDRLYALVEAPRKDDGLYRSDDSGESFMQISDKMQLLNRPFYYTNLYADPSNADRLFSLATRAFQSNDGGKTWKSFNAAHGDHHDIWINPDNSDLMVQANDGGANISFNSGKTWSSQFNQPTSEIYQIEVDNNYPYWVYGGQQDNYTTVSVPSLPPYGMQAGHTAYIKNTGGCETGPAVPNPDDPNIVYSNCKGKFSRYNKLTGQEQHYNVGNYYMYGHDPKDLPFRFQRVSPIHVSPHDSKIIYHCSQFVHKTTDEGKTWEQISPDLTAFTSETQGISGSPITRDITGEEFYSTIYAIQESKLEKGVIWVGANDGPIHVTRDGGINWDDVTPKVLGPGGRVDGVEPSSHKEGKAFACVLRYQLGDPTPYIFKTLDYGKSWKLVNKGIPDDFPVRVLREDPEVEGLLYAGTEYGLFVSYDDGDNWEQFKSNLPIVPITDIKIHRGDLVMSTMGRGFWVLDDITVLRQNRNLARGHMLYKPADTYAYIYETRKPNDAIYDHVQYPSPRVNFDYHLDKEIKGDLFMEVVDEKGKVVRRYKSFTKGKKDSLESKDDMNTSTYTFKENKGLKKAKGFHRFYWDLKNDLGVLMNPGSYTVRLFSKGIDLTKEFKLLEDPRFTEEDISSAEYEFRMQFLNQVAKLMEESKSHVKTLKEEIKKMEKMDNRTNEESMRLEMLRSKLAKFENDSTVHYPRQMFEAQVKYLFSTNNRAYQAINKDAQIRLEQLLEEFETLKSDLKVGS